MNSHHDIQQLLYDYATGGLLANERDRVKEHCATCAECRSDLEAIRSVTESLTPHSPLPSDERSDRFWTQFAENVERQVSEKPLRAPGIWMQFFDELKIHLTGSWKPVGAAAAVLTVAIVAFVILHSPSADAPVEPAPATMTSQSDSTTRQLADYYRRSRALLVGINNLSKAPGMQLDLSKERRTSRRLAMEARALRAKDLDPQSTQLVGDLERLFIELASAEDQHQEPVLNLVRTGMEQENVLFKIRMAETAYGTGGVMLTGGRR
jgi:anti-sigma factor RsiW